MPRFRAAGVTALPAGRTAEGHFRFGVCDNALAAADFAALPAFGFLSTLLAADAAFALVCLVFLLVISLHLHPCAMWTSRHRGWSDTGERPALGHSVGAPEARSARTGPRVLVWARSARFIRSARADIVVDPRSLCRHVGTRRLLVASRDAVGGRIWMVANAPLAWPLALRGQARVVVDREFVVTHLRGSSLVYPDFCSCSRWKPALVNSLVCPPLTATGRAAAAFADEAGAGGPHFRTTCETERAVDGGAGDLLQELG
jgi:hypothetical protein